MAVDVQQIAALIAHHNGGDAADYITKGEVDDVVISHETMADWENSARNHWREHRTWREREFQGIKYVELEGVQLHKGDTRRNFILIALADGRTATWGL